MTHPSQPAFDTHYLGFFECFNNGEYFEAHEVLEHLWLKVRKEPIGNFHKGLIQLAGAFVHIRKARKGPALSLLRLAEANLSSYPAVYEELDVATVLSLIRDWRGFLHDLTIEAVCEKSKQAPPQIRLGVK